MKKLDEAEAKVTALEGEREALRKRNREALAILDRVSNRSSEMGMDDIKDICLVADLISEDQEVE